MWLYAELCNQRDDGSSSKLPNRILDTQKKTPNMCEFLDGWKKKSKHLTQSEMAVSLAKNVCLA